MGLPLCIGHSLTPCSLQARSFHIFCFRFHHSSDSLFAIIAPPLPIRISVISHIIIYISRNLLCIRQVTKMGYKDMRGAIEEIIGEKKTQETDEEILEIYHECKLRKIFKICIFVVTMKMNVFLAKGKTIVTIDTIIGVIIVG